MSVLVRPDAVDASRWPWLPLMAGLAVAATVRREGGIEAGLKWPNDVVVAMTASWQGSSSNASKRRTRHRLR